MSRMDKLSPYATTISTSADGDICIVYHSTCIVQFNDDRIILCTGGYDTVTTRRKMNQASNQFGLNYQVYRKRGETFVGGGALAFSEAPLNDGININRKLRAYSRRAA